MRPKRHSQAGHLLEGKILLGSSRQKCALLNLLGTCGVRKTTLGWLIGKNMKLPYVSLSAVNIGIKERNYSEGEAPEGRIFMGRSTGSTSSSRTLYPRENGDIVLIGAHNRKSCLRSRFPTPFPNESVTLKLSNRKDLCRLALSLKTMSSKIQR